MKQNWQNRIIFIFFYILSPSAFSANVILPPTPDGSSFYILPGIYGAAGDNFFLFSTFNAPDGNIAGGRAAVTITGPGTFTLSNTGTINQSIGGSTGVSNHRAIVLAKAGATVINLGNINGTSNSAVENTFGMSAVSIQSGFPVQSAYAFNYGTITMQGASTDGMNAAGTSIVRSYATNYGTINVSDRITGVSSWIEGMSGVGNGSVTNETTGIINAHSKAGSQGSSALFGGYNVPSFSGTNAFSMNDPQMINKGTLNSFDDSHGFYYWGNFQTYARNDGLVNILGRGHGVYFDNVDNVTMGAGSGFENSTAGVISTQNENSYGIYLRFGNNTFAVNQGIIQTVGNKAHGIIAYSSGSSATNSGTITTSGNLSAGIFYSGSALNSSTHRWNLGSVVVNGTNSFGIATPQSFFRNDGIIVVNGANSFGMLAGGSYDIVPDGTIPDNTNLGGLTPLSASQGAAQTAFNHGIINATAVTTVGLGAQGAGSLAINALGATINATGSGVGLLARGDAIAQNFGIINVDSNSIGMSIGLGSSGLNAGLINFTGQNGTLIGDIQNSGTLYYDAGNGSANYTISLGPLTNSGDIYLGGTPGNTLTFDGADYIGQNGFVNLNTFLASDNSPSNLLLMNGGSATGSTSLVITNANGPGALTVGNGILVVNTINGGTTSGNAFHLDAPAVAGPYEYYLVRGAKDGSNSQNWYLLSTFDNPDPPIPPSPDYPIGDNIPYYSREVSLATAIPSVALLYDQFILSTLHQRVGEQEQIIGRQLPQVYMNGIWLRAMEQNGTLYNNGIYRSGPSFNYYFNALQMGVDAYHATNQNGSSSFAGLLGAYGKEHGSVDHLEIINAGRNDFDAWTLGGYFTHYDPHGWYIDNVLLGTFHQIDANSERGLGSILANGYGVAGSVEGGYNFGLPYGFGIEPEAQLVIERLSLNNSRDVSAIISFDPTNSLIGRLGMRLTRTWEISSFTPNIITGWLFGNLWREFQGNSRTNFSSLTGNIPFSSNLGGNSTQLGFGLTAMVSHNVSIYGTANYTKYWNDHGHSGGGEVGVRLDL